MGENSGIQWTTHTFNPWVGCQRVSPGCVHCYAESYDKRVGGVPKKQRADPNVPETRWGPNGKRTRTTASNWNQPLKWDAAAKTAGERHRVFCSSLADVFEDRPELAPWRLDLFQLIAFTPHLDWLLLTKRPENIDRMLPRKNLQPLTAETWPNVWLGTTVEDQQRANERIPELLKVPAKVRFLSCEPLLERVTLNPWLLSEHGRRHIGAAPGISWVIIGGESGGGARPFHLEWARDLVSQCRAAGVAPFVKQLGQNATVDYYRHVRELDVGGFDTTGCVALGWNYRDGQPPIGSRARYYTGDSHGGDMAEWPDELRVREFPR